MYDYIALHQEVLSIQYKTHYKDMSYEGILEDYRKNYQKILLLNRQHMVFIKMIW